MLKFIEVIQLRNIVDKQNVIIEKLNRAIDMALVTIDKQNNLAEDLIAQLQKAHEKNINQIKL